MRYFDLIFTLHAQDKMEARGVRMEEAWEAFKHANRVVPGNGHSKKFEKEFGDFKISVIAAQNKNNEWVVKSAWRNPPLPGTPDAKQKKIWKKYNKSGFLGQIWLQLKQQLGI